MHLHKFYTSKHSFACTFEVGNEVTNLMRGPDIFEVVLVKWQMNVFERRALFQ